MSLVCAAVPCAYPPHHLSLTINTWLVAAPLQHVDLNGAGFTVEGLNIILQFLCTRLPPRSQLLMNVWVDGCATEAERVKFYAQLLKRRVDKETKSMAVVEFPSRREHVAALLGLLPKLRELSISDTNLTDVMEVLPKVVKSNTSLETLKLNDNNLNDEHIAKLMRALGHNRTLVNLEFENNPTTQKGASRGVR